MRQVLFSLYLTFLIGTLSWCQKNPPRNIKTIQLKPLEGNDITTIVPLGTVLRLSFDDLDADSKEYQYKIELMTSDWKHSNLTSNQYIRGFNQNAILNYDNSFNTLQSYTHYWVEIPNSNTVITKSGNYLISVLDENEDIVFSRRFTFYEKLSDVQVSVHRSRDAKTIDKDQTVQFVINYPNLTIDNPIQEVKVALLQNQNWKTAILNLKPQFFQQNQLSYKYTKRANFSGGNEFLNFDNKSIRATNLKIAKTELKDIFHNYLYPDIPRADRRYVYNPDINGQFVVRTLEGSNPYTEADYALVHFSLETQPYKGERVYVFGGFNNFELTPYNVMSYNEEKGEYQVSIILKQGFYNYSYVTKDADGNVDTDKISGSFYQTENRYTVLVYYRPFGGLYDRVIGFGNVFFDQNMR